MLVGGPSAREPGAYDPSVTRVPPSQDPLVGVRRLLVDGTNLLHALAGGNARQPPSAVVGRLRAAIPPEIAIELVFDGPGERGLRGERIARDLAVRYGGRHSADTVLITLVEEAGIASPGGAGGVAEVLVVTDDRELRFAVARRGARTAGTGWLIRRLDRPRPGASGTTGHRRPPAPIAQPQPGSLEEEASAEARRWSPGRGATRKRGNARRAPKGRPSVG
jgi:hypothetical protein